MFVEINTLYFSIKLLLITTCSYNFMTRLLIAQTLFFTVPPQKPVIISEDSEVVEHTGPFFEGNRVKLTCMVSGGNKTIINHYISYFSF